MHFRQDVEGLRAVAVAAVLLYHFGVPGMGGGYIGVDVFFVISGFLITSLLLAERERAGRVSILAFYARRARRLLPISTTVLIATAGASIVLLPPTRIADVARDVVAAGAFAANLLFAHRGTDYLTAGLPPSPLQHYWSLAVEEQFYLLWPALIAAVTFRTRRRSTVRLRVAAAVGVIVVVSYVASGTLTAMHPSWSYFGPHTRAWELGVGAFLAAIGSAVARLSPAIRGAAGWIGLAGIVASVATFGEVERFPGWAAAVPVLSTGLVLVAGAGRGEGPTTLLGGRPLLWLGSRSYSLYLWHWPVLVLTEARLGAPLDPAIKVVLILLVVALAELGFRGVEQPVRTSATLVARPGWSMAVGGALVSAVFLTGIVTAVYRPDLRTGVVAAAPALATTTTADPGPSTTSPPAVSTTTTVEPAPPAPVDMSTVGPIAAIVSAASNELSPDNLRPNVYDAVNDTPVIYPNGCHEYYATTVRTDCVFGDPDGAVTIALWGDSHAGQWFTPLDTIARQRGWRLLALTQGGCPVLEIETYNRGTDEVLRHCGPWRAAARQYMRDQGVDFVLLGQYYGLKDAQTRAAMTTAQWEAALPPLLDSLRTDGMEPIVIGDSPDPPGNVPECVAANRRSLTSCAPPALQERALAIDMAVAAIARRTSVSFFEPARWLCAPRLCPVVVGDLLVYRDEHHIGNTFAAWMTPLLDEALSPFIEDYLAYRALVARSG